MLQRVSDPRTKEGIRHQIKDVLLMCIMAIMSQRYGYRAMGRFMKRHEKEFTELLHLKHGVPSYVTIRDVLQRIDFAQFCEVFNEWAGQYMDLCKGNTLALDGKAIRSTVTACSSAQQNFISLVSVFASQRGIVIRCGKIENNKESELPTARALIEALDIGQELYTLDALHCQKKQPNV